MNRYPSACVIDAQSVEPSTPIPAASQGVDAGKKIVGRKRSIITDTLGLPLAVRVTAAAMIRLAMTDLMASLGTRENTISWRNPAPAHRSRMQG